MTVTTKRYYAYGFLTVLLMSTLLFGVSPLGSFGVAAADSSGTLVGGTLTADTTWTPQGSPYTFTGIVTVARGVTLTIMSGTVVDLGSSKLLIEGTLQAIGKENNRIKFEGENLIGDSWPPRIFFNSSSTAWNETTYSGCIIDHAEFHLPNYQYETIMGDYPKISNNIFYNYGCDAAAIRTNGLIVNNTILGGYRGIIAQFNATILYNTVRDSEVGICCGYMSFDPTYHPTLIGNLLINNTVGIYDSACAPYITNNTITQSTYGLFFTRDTFDSDAEPVGIICNNIYGNIYNVCVDFLEQRTINMAYNWWGTTDESAIANSICDLANRTASGKIVFKPFLTEPVSQVVPNSDPPTLNPTPIPTVTASSTPNAIETPKPNDFNIESNSTVTALSFNSTSGEISFTVNGTTGTTGYVKATIAKAFMPNGAEIKVNLDGNPINYTLTDAGDNWIILFTYHHSSHQVTISQQTTQTPQESPSAATFDSPYVLYILLGVAAGLAVLLGLMFWATKKKN